MENKQASSTGPSLRACLRNDCSTIGVTVVHNVIVRKQTEPSLRACLEGSTISVTVKPSLSCCLDGHGSFISKNETSLGLANAKKNSINEDIDALGTVTCVSPVTHDVVSKHQLCKMRKDSKQLRTIVRNLERNRYQGTEAGDRLISAAALVMPKASQESLQSATALIVAGVCVNVGIPQDDSCHRPRHPRTDTPRPHSYRRGVA
mmetsp:Transcript_52291/g.63017  ORF Transcript_52291/g.63017 Transcript_52291/m.63017 type:complete len:205 (-) Transcript_52291:984-1598(-)